MSVRLVLLYNFFALGASDESHVKERRVCMPYYKPGIFEENYQDSCLMFQYISYTRIIALKHVFEKHMLMDASTTNVVVRTYIIS